MQEWSGIIDLRRLQNASDEIQVGRNPGVCHRCRASTCSRAKTEHSELDVPRLTSSDVSHPIATIVAYISVCFIHRRWWIEGSHQRTSRVTLYIGKGINSINKQQRGQFNSIGNVSSHCMENLLCSPQHTRRFPSPDHGTSLDKFCWESLWTRSSVM